MEKMASMRSCHNRVRVSSASLEVPSKGRASDATSRKRPRAMAAELDRPKGPGRIMSTTAFLWCLDVMDRLMVGPAARVFNELRGRDGSRALDFERVKYKLEEGDYESADDFAEDVVLTLATAVELGSPSASGLLGTFETEWRQVRESLKPKKFNVKDRSEESVRSSVISTVTHQTRRSDDQKAALIRRSVERISDRCPATSTMSSSVTSSCSSRERLEYRSINSARQLRSYNDSIERQREAARRKIAAMTNTAGLTDNFESMIEFNRLLKGKSWSAQYVPCWSRAGYQIQV